MKKFIFKDGKGFQPAMMLNPETKKKILDKRKKKSTEENKGLWHNIHMKRKRGEKMRKKGDPGAPSPEAMARAKAKSEVTTTASIPNPADTAMGPKLKTTVMHDRRRKKDKHPKLLKRFSKYLEDNGVI